MKPPIFIIGNPRSGTTLMRLLISGHKNIVIPPESSFAVWLYSKYEDQPTDSSFISKYIVDLMQTKKIDTWNLNNKDLYEYLLSQNKYQSYGDFVSRIYLFYAHKQKKSAHRWGDKNNSHIMYLSAIDKIFPKAYYIHIIRDGRDVACSYRDINRRNINSRYVPKLPQTIEAIAKEWLDNNNNTIELLAKKEKKYIITVRYEDLVTDTVNTLKKICCQIGEKFDKKMTVNYLKKNDEPQEFIAWKEKIRQAPTSSQKRRYIREMTVKEIKKFNQIAKELLKTYNYI